MKTTKIITSIALAFLFIGNSYAQKSTARVAAKIILMKPFDRIEFKNIKFSDEDKEAILKIYKNNMQSMRMAQVVNGEVVESYGKADIKNVTIISQEEANDSQRKGNWIISKKLSFMGAFEEHFITWETKNLTVQEKQTLEKILLKYGKITTVEEGVNKN